MGYRGRPGGAAGRGGLERTSGPVARCCCRRDQLTAHVAQRVGWFVREPSQCVGVLDGRHAGVAADLDAHRGEVRCGAVVGAVRVAWRHSDSGRSLDERADDADACGRDVLVTRHGAARQVRGRDLRAERGGDRVSPRDPFKLCGVHGSSTSWEPITQPRLDGQTLYGSSAARARAAWRTRWSRSATFVARRAASA